MNAIRCFEPEYNLGSFLRDLKKIRSNTFTPNTIKHSFVNSGMWPMSFKMVKRKLKEYGKKTKQDVGIDSLEYGEVSESEDEGENADVEPTTLEGDPRLDVDEPLLPQLPSSYAEVRGQLDVLDPKIQAGLSSPSRKRYIIAKQGADEFLMRASLDHAQIQAARKAQVVFHKKKLTSRVSLQNGGSLLASVALEKVKKKEVEIRDAALKTAKAQLAKEERRIRDELLHKGVSDRKAERERKKWLKEQYDLHKRGIPAPIPEEKLHPIRDRQKERTLLELEDERIRTQGFRDAVAREEAELDTLKSRDPESFALKGIPVDPQILQIENDFRIKQNPLNAIQIDSDDDSGNEENIQPSSPFALLRHIGIKGERKEEGEGEDIDIDMPSSPPISVVSIDSIEGNMDFIRFK